MQLKPNEIHVWSAELTLNDQKETERLAVLSKDECERARCFHFALHQKRFIAGRSILREILGLYLDLAPKDIVFAYTEHKKPFLLFPSQSNLYFNLSHSENMAIYVFTLHHAIGVDIERIKKGDQEGLAKRFFSRKENEELMSLPADERVSAFYRIWSRKEAIIKANGKGLSMPLSSFSVSSHPILETIIVLGEQWSLFPLSVHPGYQAAVATNQIVKKIFYYRG